MLRQRLDWVTLEVSSHLDGSVNTVRLGLKGRRRFGRAGRAAKKKWRAATEQVVVRLVRGGVWLWLPRSIACVWDVEKKTLQWLQQDVAKRLKGQICQ